jgi:hypothetical protein
MKRQAQINQDSMQDFHELKNSLDRIDQSHLKK